MNKLKYLPSLLCLFLIIFTSCENEPLEGTFITELPLEAEEGQFVAKIGEEDFIADNVVASISANNVFSITGTKEGGESISIIIEDAGIGIYNLTTGGGVINGAAYNNGTDPISFTTEVTAGGAGNLDVTDIDIDELLVSGTFEFTGVRPELDEEGNVVFDDNGSPITETIEITSGNFLEIEFILDATSTDINDQFNCMVGNNPTDLASLEATLETVADVNIIKIVATQNNESVIRLDIPEALGVGTFDMVNISDGTQLIGFYTPQPAMDTFSSNPGTITITELDTETGILKATFSFTATDPLEMNPAVFEISEGVLDIDYIE